MDHERLRDQPAQALADLAGLIGEPGWQPTFMFRMGHPVRSVAPSPRRPVSEVLL